jgi:hypothetical protein
MKLNFIFEKKDRKVYQKRFESNRKLVLFKNKWKRKSIIGLSCLIMI